jgi:hypothetical protein
VYVRMWGGLIQYDSVNLTSLEITQMICKNIV